MQDLLIYFYLAKNKVEDIRWTDLRSRDARQSHQVALEDHIADVFDAYEQLHGLQHEQMAKIVLEVRHDIINHPKFNISNMDVTKTFVGLDPKGCCYAYMNST